LAQQRFAQQRSAKQQFSQQHLAQQPMAQATARLNDTLLPRTPGGNRAGAAMALLVHLGLLVALTFSVDWRSKTPDVVSAELWSAVPQTAAPKPVERLPEPTPPTPPKPLPKPLPTVTPQSEPTPPPPAREPDINIERAKLEAAKKKAAAEEAKKEAAELAKAKLDDKKKADADKKKREQEQLAKQAKADDDKLARQREENLKRMMGQATTNNNTGTSNNPNSTGTAAQDAAPSASYVGKLAKRIRDENLVYTGTAPDNATVEVTIRSAAGGTLLGRDVVKRSGFPDWDEAVLRAIDKAGSLPRDENGRVPREITIAFRRRD
jgi:colicin import membrane protein